MSTPHDRIEAKLGLTGASTVRIGGAPPVIPDHELIRPIGQGAYGEVWLARNTLGALRAVKVLYRDNFKDIRPYEREFGGIRRFEPLSRANEGFVDVLQVGRNDTEGWFYYIMELADPVKPEPDSMLAFDPKSYEPRTLSRVLHERRRLPLENCLELGLTLTLALGYLHRHGLIHRDIKPANIIFVGGVAKLADIGLVTEAAGANTFVGTEGFVPPEGPTSAQADLFALGKVLYEAAMGKDRNEFPEPHSQLAADQESLALMELNTVLLRACEPDPKQRYASAEEMNADLALLHSGGSVRRRHRLERHFRIAQRAGAIAGAVALLAGSAWFWQQQQTGRMTNLAAEKTALATEKTLLVESLSKVAEENRQRIVRLNIASGVRLLDEGDTSGALLWFAETLPMVTNIPSRADVHRIRIQQTLDQTPRVLQVFPHEKVRRLAFSPDGRRIVTGTAGGEICVWDAGSGAPLWSPLGLDVDDVWQVRFLQGGQRIFASSLPEMQVFVDQVRPKIAVILDVEAGNRLVSVSATNLLRADLSPDDRWIVTADTEHVIQVHDAQNGKSLAKLRGHTGRVMMFAFSKDGKVLASTSEDWTVRLWRLPSGESIGSPLRFPSGRGPIALNWDGTLLATSGSVRELATSGSVPASVVETWDVETGARVGAPIDGEAAVLLFVAPGGERVCIDFRGEIGVFHSRSHERVSPPIRYGFGGCNALNPEHTRLALGGSAGLLGIWNLETGEQHLPAILLEGMVDLVFSPDGSKLAAQTDRGTVILATQPMPTETTSRRLGASLSPGRTDVRNILSANRRQLLLPHDALNEKVSIVDLERLTDWEFPHRRANGFCLDVKGRQVAFAYPPAVDSGDHLMELWRLDSGTNCILIPYPTNMTSSFMRFSADGTRVVAACADRQVRIWSTKDGSLQRSLPVPEGLEEFNLLDDALTLLGVFYQQAGAPGRRLGMALMKLDGSSAAQLQLPGFISKIRILLDPSANRLAFAAEEPITQVFDTRTGEPLSPILHHGGALNWVDFSPDGKRLLTAGLTPEIRIWDVATGGQLVEPLRLGTKPIEVALWSLDGRFIVARSDENLVRVWDAATGEPVTPVLKHGDFVRYAILGQQNRLITVSLPDRLRVWELKPTHLSPEILIDYARFVSGRRVTPAGSMLRLSPTERAELGRSLLNQAPELLQSSNAPGHQDDTRAR